jgi:hypothetical protein
MAVKPRTPRVHNKYHNTAPPDAVYIGRGSPWGNQFVIGPDGDRDEVCDKHQAYVDSTPGLKARIRKELRGRDVVCFCKPKRCHGDYLVKVANSNKKSKE